MKQERRFSLAVGTLSAAGWLGLGLSLAGASIVAAQTAATTPTKVVPATQHGTVKAISGNSLTVTSDTGAQVAVSVPETAKILQVAPGSTDLKAAQAIALSDIAVGDKVLVTGKPGDTADAFNASRVILMKSGDIAQKHAAEQADWQRRGLGGIVAAVGPESITLSSGAKKIQIQVTGMTVFRRYAADSIKFEDAKSGVLAQIQPGDQLEVRGTKSDDGLSVQAEEIVSGSFRNLSGTLATVNAATGTITLKDLTTKKTMTVTITANSDVRKLPPELAARFAARQRGGADAAPGAPGGTSAGGSGATARPANAAGQAPTRPDGAPAGSMGTGAGSGSGRPGGYGGGPGGGYGGAGGGMGRSAGMDLSKMLTRLPTATIADLHNGDAVMIVASQAQGGGDAVTAVTLLSGVEPILAATPSGTQAMTLSPWSVGSGAPEGAGGP